MKLTNVLMKILYAFFMMGCKDVSGQLANGGGIEITSEKKIEFRDADVLSMIRVSGVVGITFTDSTNLKPVSVQIKILKMKGERQYGPKQDIDFIYFYSKDGKLNDLENSLLKRYSTKIDSMFMNSSYAFSGDDKWVPGRKWDISFSFGIVPTK